MRTPQIFPCHSPRRSPSAFRELCVHRGYRAKEAATDVNECTTSKNAESELRHSLSPLHFYKEMKGGII